MKRLFRKFIAFVTTLAVFGFAVLIAMAILFYTLPDVWMMFEGWKLCVVFGSMAVFFTLIIRLANSNVYQMHAIGVLKPFLWRVAPRYARSRFVELEKWCDVHALSLFFADSGEFYFRSASDATLFRLTWPGDVSYHRAR